jgi:17beta-estradiol 17-dehydrogenase / very-long-chain 3-oxoacyl-CoA reductase
MTDCVCSEILRIAGAIFLAYLAIRVLGFFYDFLLRGKKSLRAVKGRWAVVTGASDGIGKEFCIQLARRGYNVALLSRSQEKLETVSAICEESKVETKVIPVDFSKHPDSYIHHLAKELSSLDVEVLVNNVGISFPYPEHYLKTDKHLDDQILNINIQVKEMLFLDIST